MRLSHLLEQYVARERRTTVRDLAFEFRISERRCRDELREITPYGVEVTEEGTVALKDGA